MKDLFKTSFHDSERAKLFDSLMCAEETTADLRELWESVAAALAKRFRLTLEESKAYCVSLIMFEISDPVERSAYLARAGAIIRALQWERVGDRKTYSLPGRREVKQ